MGQGGFHAQFVEEVEVDDPVVVVGSGPGAGADITANDEATNGNDDSGSTDYTRPFSLGPIEKARYIRLQHCLEHVHVQEVEVYDSCGVNIALQDFGCV